MTLLTRGIFLYNSTLSLVSHSTRPLQRQESANSLRDCHQLGTRRLSIRKTRNPVSTKHPWQSER
ncbi:hypothetical protein [Microseira sp. BLCC-F43]|uniref:hypothetical protein n=1 Tax=Microseira sp. BLCC-F43 TaxID=3153602 RepID=UPI0035BA1DD2